MPQRVPGRHQCDEALSDDREGLEVVGWVACGADQGNVGCAAADLLDEAMFINAAVDGPPDKCSISTSIQWAEDADFTRWQTSVGGDTLGPANAFTERGPYPVAIAYRLRFSDGRDTGWSSNEVIVLRREGGPNRLTEPRFVDD